MAVLLLALALVAYPASYFFLIRPSPYPPDRYRDQNSVVRAVYAPIHWIDRQVRPQYRVVQELSVELELHVQCVCE
jgi:hypothetical protein